MKKILLLIPFALTIAFSLVGCNHNTLNWFEKLEIKREYLEYCEPEFSIRNIHIDYYIGEYNDYDILMISCDGYDVLTYIRTDQFDDVEITYPNSNSLEAYKDGKFYSLIELYEDGELVKEDIISIRDIYYELKS